MKAFLWQIARAAIVERSPEAIRIAAEALSSRLPISAQRIEAFLRKLVDLAIGIGDGFLDQMGASILGLASAAEGPGEPLPQDIDEFGDVVLAMQSA